MPPKKGMVVGPQTPAAKRVRRNREEETLYGPCKKRVAQLVRYTSIYMLVSSPGECSRDRSPKRPGGQP